MSLGAVYVYHSAVVRQLIGAAVIPVTMLVRRGGRSRGAACAAPTGANSSVTPQWTAGAALVCLGVSFWCVRACAPLAARATPPTIAARAGRSTIIR